MTKRKTIGLALGSGGARGIAHIGVIKALTEQNIPIDYIAGTSSGALIGGLYAAIGLEKLIDMVNQLNYFEFISIFSDPFSTTGLFKGQKLIEYLERHLGNINIEELPIPFRAVATNIVTGRAEIISSGNLCEAIRASSSIPVIFEPIEIDESFFVDGAITMPVPVSVVREMGADTVVGVNVYPSGCIYKKHGKPGIMDMAITSINMLLHSLSIANVKEADVVINIEDLSLGTFDFISGKNVIAAGEDKTNAVLRIKDILI